MIYDNIFFTYIKTSVIVIHYNLTLFKRYLKISILINKVFFFQANFNFLIYLQFVDALPNFPLMLKKCILNAVKNKPGHKGNRFHPDIKEISMYVFIRGGPKLYEFFINNFHWPSVSSQMDKIPKFHPSLIEGKLYIDEFMQFLNRFDYPLQCAILEDGTAITNIIEVDRKTDLLLGLVAPISVSTGLIHPFYFKATSAKEIYENIKNNYSASYVYVILAKPLKRGIHNLNI